MHLPCPIRIILISGSVLSNQSLLCWVCLIAMDRMLRTIFLQNYATKFNPLRYKITVCIFLAISVLQTGAWIFGALGEPGLGAKLISPLVILSFIAIVVFYFVSIKRIGDNVQNRNGVSTDTTSLTKMASIYVTLFIVVFTPAIICFACIDIMVKNMPFWYVTVLSVPVYMTCLLYTSPSPRDGLLSRMPSSA